MRHVRINPPAADETDGPLDSIEIVVDAGPRPYLHCMPCGATHELHDTPLTVDAIVRCAQDHLPHCSGEVDQ